MPITQPSSERPARQPQAESQRKGPRQAPPRPRGGLPAAYCVLPAEETAMTDKSPHDAHSAKKSGKALKAKRSERREKEQAAAQMQQLMHPRKQGR